MALGICHALKLLMLQMVQYSCLQKRDDLHSVEDNGGLGLVVRQAVEHPELVHQHGTDHNKVQHGHCSSALNEDLSGAISTACLPEPS